MNVDKSYEPRTKPLDSSQSIMLDKMTIFLVHFQKS